MGTKTDQVGAKPGAWTAAIKSICSICLTSVLFFGCEFLGKQDGATGEVFTHRNSFIEKIDPQSNFTRLSGPVLYMRISKLFPDMAYRDQVITASSYDPLLASGINRSLIQFERPSNALAQIAVQKNISTYCMFWTRQGSFDGVQTSGLFSTQNILYSDEKLPDDPITRTAFAVARNVWLENYKADSPEVLELAALYHKAYQAAQDYMTHNPDGRLWGEASDGLYDQNVAIADNATRDAKLAVCVASMTSAQFLIGISGPHDALRRAALELGRVVPTMADFEAFDNKKITLSDYVTALQQKPGYISAVTDWHKEWLGLRSTFGGGDPRGHQAAMGESETFSAIGTTLYRSYLNVGPDGDHDSNYVAALNTAVGNHEFITRNPGQSLETNGCVAMKNGSLNIQAFDPRTKLITFEAYNSGQARFEISGGFVIADSAQSGLSQYRDMINAYTGGSIASVNDLINPAVPRVADCKLIDSSFVTFSGYKPVMDADKALADYPKYYRCRGRLAATDGSGAFKATEIDDDISMYNGSFTNISQNGNVVWQNPHIGTIGNPRGKTRIQRFGPSGISQDGISEIKLWYTGKPAYVCNALERYRYTCAYRPPSSVQGDTAWHHAADTNWYTGGGVMDSTSTPYDQYQFTNVSAHPYLLNQFRCGVPDVGRVEAAVDNSSGMANAPNYLGTNEFSAFPHGYDTSPAGYLIPTTAPTRLNTTATIAAYTGNGGLRGEGDAIGRLNQDLTNEPYALLAYILKNDLSYKELLTANYTIGHEELELFYRTQGMYIPVYPQKQGSRYVPTAVDSAERTNSTPVKIPLGEFAMSSNLVGARDYNHFYGGGASPYANKTGIIPPKPSAGILSMPAFISPVSSSMRTLSARYFARLLCGQAPNIFVPQGNEIAVQNNAAASINQHAADHVKRSECRACHINLDPLGAALSPHYLENVQLNEYTAFQGEMYRSNLWGVRYGPEKGVGAFLGKPVRGLQEVAQVLVASDLWASCVVQKTFENVFGRGVGQNDAKLFADLVVKFKGHYNYNHLVRDMVATPAYNHAN